MSSGVIFALIFLAGWLAYRFAGTDLAVYLAVAAVSLATGTALYHLLVRIAPDRYRNIEV